MYVTSDTHFGHNQEFIYKNRGYEDPISMNVDMIASINNIVGENGILLHLGDFSLNTTLPDYIEIIRSLKIKELWMLYGNHNSPHFNFHQYNEIDDITCKVYNKGYYWTMRHARKQYVCSHFPFQIWDDQSKNVMHLHGHCHGNLKSSLPQHTIGKILDVGWCIHRKPLHISEIEQIMSNKTMQHLHHA